MGRQMQIFLLVVSCLLMIGELSAQIYPVDTMMYHGSPDKFVNIVFLGDGFTESEQNTFLEEVENVSTYIFNTSPFREYHRYFNVFAISVPSAESGTDHPGTAMDVTEPVFPVASANTSFNSTFDAGFIHRLLVASNSAAINSVLMQNFPLYDQVLILVNSPHYGGSGGVRAVGSLHPSAAEIMLHEMGHSFGGLADEYYAGDQYANELPNMTQQTNPGLVRWKNWMGDFGIGIYQHCCGGNSANWYRPHEGCKMRVLGAQNPFCSVCTETLIERIHDLIGIPIANYSPEESVVSACGAPLSFIINPIKPDPNTLSITWILNGMNIAVQTDSVIITADQLQSGINSLLAEITDDTELVRKDGHPSKHTYYLSWQIDFEPIPDPLIVADGPTTFCEGDSVTLTCDPATSYVWNTGDSTQSIVVRSSGVYNVTVTNAYGCTAIAEREVTVQPLPEAIILEGENIEICAGASTTLTAGGGIAYYWNTGETTQSIEVTDEGEYVVTVENADGCIAVSPPVTVYVFSQVQAGITPASPVALCSGDSIALVAGEGSTYLWNTGDTTRTIDVSMAGSYQVTVTSTSGCSAVSDPVVVDIHDLPMVSVIPADSLSFCEGDSAYLNAAGGISYSWSNGDTSAIILISESGTYTVTVTGEGGCSAVASPVEVTVYPRPPAGILADGPTDFCAGDSVSLMATPSAGYLWNTGDTSAIILVYQPGVYSVTVTNPFGCLASTGDVQINVFTPPAKPVITQLDSILASSAPSGNQWYLNDSLLAGSTEWYLIPLVSGTYHVVVTDSNGCTASSDPYTFWATGTESPESGQVIRVIPNPNSGSFRILADAPEVAWISIISSSGTCVYYSESFSEDIDLSGQPRGAYTVLLSAGGRIFRGMILIQ